MTQTTLATVLTGVDTLAWLAEQGAGFCRVKAGEKNPFEGGWQQRPLTLDDVIPHADAGGNVGMLGGVGDLYLIDLDGTDDGRLGYSEFVSFFQNLANAPYIKRDGADKGKIIVRVTDQVLPSTTRKEDHARSPYFELLAAGKQGVVAGTHPTGVPYELHNADQEIPTLLAETIDAYVEIWTGRPLFETITSAGLIPRNENHPNGHGYREQVLAAWSTLEIFDRFGYASEIRKERGELRLLKNGGLLVRPDTNKWYCHSEQVGGHQLEAWWYCRYGNTNVPKGPGFLELLDEMAETAGIPVPDRQKKNMMATRHPIITSSAGQADNTDHNHQQDTPEAGKDTAEQPKSRVRALSNVYLERLTEHGYSFTMCDLDDRVYVNSAPMLDTTAAEIRQLIRDLDILDPEYRYNVEAAEDIYTAEAGRHRFNPLKEKIETLRWDGRDHIKRMGHYIKDKDGLFPVFFHRWLLGAIAKLYAPAGKQNRVLVLNGLQDAGKSSWVKWLASPFGEGYYSNTPIHADDKDSRLARTDTYVWEIEELTSVTARQDRNALKAFLSAEITKDRRPYHRYEVAKPNIANFIATVNDEGGFFNDPTGSRRYMTVTLKEINWRGYTTEMDPAQLWAQAKHLYDQGETGDLTDEEKTLANDSNDQYRMVNPVGEYMSLIVVDDPRSAIMVTDILDALKAVGAKMQDNQLTLNLGAWMTENGYERVVGDFYTDAGRRRQGTGWLGVRLEYTPQDEITPRAVQYPIERVRQRSRDHKKK